MSEPKTIAINDGDLYVNDGESFIGGDYYPGVPEEQKEAERDETAAISGSYPINAKIAEWFKAAILDSDDIHNISISEIKRGDVTYSRTISVEAQILAFQLYKEKMTEKFDEFKKFIEEDES